MNITLAVDVGGSGIKAILLNSEGLPISPRVRIETPHPAQPEPVIAAIAQLASQLVKEFGEYTRVSVGFPGVVNQGVTRGAVNLGKFWNDFHLAKRLEQVLKKPVRVANDADVQGYGAVI